MCKIRTKEIKRTLLELARLFTAVFTAVCVLARPDVAAQGAAHGLTLCCKTVIPALFPFFVLSQIIVTSPLAGVVGLVLSPYTRLLGIRKKSAPTALLLGLVGGFGGGAQAVGTLYHTRALSRRESALLLCCAVNAGPAFVIGGVGASLLGSSAAGVLLFAALCCASLVTGAVMRLFYAPDKDETQTTNAIADTNAPTGAAGLTQALRTGVDSTLLLCGYVVFFSLLIALLTPPACSDMMRFVMSLPLEVTTACAAAAALPQRLYACCLAVSVMGASILLQVRALTDSALPLLPLLLSRLLHAPLSLAFTWALLRLFPIALPAAAQPVIRMRMPADACLVVFLLCCTFFCIFPTRGRTSLQKTQNSVY